jgi:hypothetical protein
MVKFIKTIYPYKEGDEATLVANLESWVINNGYAEKIEAETKPKAKKK